MTATNAPHLEFAPPPPPGMLRAFGVAIAAHVLLAIALSLGVSWKHSDDTLASAEAELWSASALNAAPKEVLAPPPPEPVAQKPVPVAEQAPPPAPPDINTEQKKKEAKRLADDEAAKEAVKDKAEDKKKTELLKKEEAKKEAKRQEALDKADAQRVEEQRQDNLKRMAGLAGGTAAPGATGAAAQSSGPSASYAGRIIGRVKPNIVFTEELASNPRAEVELRVAPEGSIISQRIVKSSGVKAWDDAVLRAIEKTGTLPRDTDGRVPSSMILGFSLRN